MNAENDSDNGPNADIDILLGQMTLAEKCTMVVGEGPWIVPGCERLGIPAWITSDGPIGVRGGGAGTGLVLPGESALAATWNPDLIEQLGAALGDEALDRNVDLLLGPTVNLHRSPLAGRHFECFSEDPELSAAMAVAYVRGVQSRGIGACIKHFVCNDQEQERSTIDVRVDETTLREVYLRPFEAAVRDADVRAVMASYNYVNGHHATAQPDLVVRILKGEWKFDGVVVSDWGAAKETVAPALHGLDVEMPGPGQWWGNDQLATAVEAGLVPEPLIDDKVRRILEFLAWRGRLPGETVTDAEIEHEHLGHRELVRRAAADGMVLIRNDGTLPLAEGASVALIGPGVEHTALLGGGSASLDPYRSTSVLDAFTRCWEGEVEHVQAIDLRRRAPTIPEAWLPDGVTVELFDGGLDGDPTVVHHRTSFSNVFFGDDLPSGRAMAARVHASMAPGADGVLRMFAASFGRCRLYVDGFIVVDNQVDQFSAGLGLTGATASLDVEAGRHYDVVLEVRPNPDSFPVVYFDAGAEMTATADTPPIESAVAAAAAADVAVVVVGSNAEWEAEGHDRKSLRLPLDQDDLVRRVAAANPNTVVVLNCGAPVELPWLDDVAAALLAWYPGQEGGEAIVDVLTGAVEAGGRMPTTWPRQLEDTPSFDHYPGVDGVVTYGERSLVGHRWFAAKGIDPLIAFGHGLSYTTFQWGTPWLTRTDDGITVEVPVSNTGQRLGSDVVQIYVGSPPRGEDPPIRLLAAFAKVHAAPGETVMARADVPLRGLARWTDQGWCVEPGDHQIVVAASSVEPGATLTYHVPAPIVLEPREGFAGGPT